MLSLTRATRISAFNLFSSRPTARFTSPTVLAEEWKSLPEHERGPYRLVAALLSEPNVSAPALFKHATGRSNTEFSLLPIGEQNRWKMHAEILSSGLAAESVRLASRALLLNNWRQYYNTVHPYSYGSSAYGPSLYGRLPYKYQQFLQAYARPYGYGTTGYGSTGYGSVLPHQWSQMASIPPMLKSLSASTHPFGLGAIGTPYGMSPLSLPLGTSAYGLGHGISPISSISPSMTLPYGLSPYANAISPLSPLSPLTTTTGLSTIYGPLSHRFSQLSGYPTMPLSYKQIAAYPGMMNLVNPISGIYPGYGMRPFSPLMGSTGPYGISGYGISGWKSRLLRESLVGGPSELINTQRILNSRSPFGYGLGVEGLIPSIYEPDVTLPIEEIDEVGAVSPNAAMMMASAGSCAMETGKLGFAPERFYDAY